jgi:ferredoxin
MAYIITEPCLSVCDGACIPVCPTECIHGPIDPLGKGKELATMENVEGKMLYIDPENCIDCVACVYVCPVDAIFLEEEVPEKWKNYIDINRDFFKGVDRDVISV